ncbi:MAG: cysteine-rich CWC family protein [Burkholderiaceae bacterium]
MSVCILCGITFSCGMADSVAGAANEPCWCTALPVIAPEVLDTLRGSNAAKSCFCPACLRAALASSTEAATALGKSLP